jgi:hypothetical protein
MIVTQIERIDNKIYVHHNMMVCNRYIEIITNIINKIFCGECNYNDVIYVSHDNVKISIYNKNGIDITSLIYSHSNPCIFHYDK